MLYFCVLLKKYKISLMAIVLLSECRQFNHESSRISCLLYTRYLEKENCLEMFNLYLVFFFFLNGEKQVLYL